MQTYAAPTGQQPNAAQPKKYDGKNGQPLYDSATGGHYGASSAIATAGHAPPPETFTGSWANVSQGLTGQYRDVLNTYWQNQVTKLENEDHDYKIHQLPLARIKKVMKADPEVKMISAEAPILFAKGCDIFITELTMRAWIHAEENKRRTLQRSDIASALAKSDMFDFLIDIVPREDATPQHKRRPDYAAGQPTYAIPGHADGAGPGQEQQQSQQQPPPMQPDMYHQQQPGMYPPPQQPQHLFDPSMYGQATGYSMEHAQDMQSMPQQTFGNQ